MFKKRKVRPSLFRIFFQRVSTILKEMKSSAGVSAELLPSGIPLGTQHSRALTLEYFWNFFFINFTSSTRACLIHLNQHLRAFLELVTIIRQPFFCILLHMPCKACYIPGNVPCDACRTLLRMRHKFPHKYYKAFQRDHCPYSLVEQQNNRLLNTAYLILCTWPSFLRPLLECKN